MTMTRTDIHRPSAIRPEDYDFVAFEVMKVDNLEDCYALKEAREAIRAHMARTGGTYSRHAHGGNCMVCGNANAIYTALFHHPKTNTYVRMGQDCAEKVEAGVDFNAFNKFRDKVDGFRQVQAGRNKAKETLEAAGFGEAWGRYVSGYSDKYEEATIVDIVGKLVRYGSISDKQMAYIGKLLTKIAERDKVAEARAVEHDLAKEVPFNNVRAAITGKVLSTKVVDTDFGKVVKILVQHRDGWKLWGSAGQGMRDAQRGDEVHFEAMVQKSRDDAKFGFFSRPTKGAVLERSVS